MDNLSLLFEKNKTGCSKVKLNGDTLYINIFPQQGLFSGIEIDRIIKIVNAAHKKYGKLKFRVELYFGRIKFIDKLAYIFLECICYYLIKIYGHPTQIYMEVESEIWTNGIISSPLLLLNHTKDSSIVKFTEKFRFEIYAFHFRRVIKRMEGVSNYLGELYEEIDRFLKLFGIDEDCRDEVALVVVELVGNADEHAQTDCLIDIDVAPDFKKYKNDICSDSNYYYGINIAVINFSEKNLGDDIKKNIINDEENISQDRYKQVIEAYKSHKDKFNNDYAEEDFCNITTFQKKISGRKEKFTTGGAGLPKLIKSLEEKSDMYRCYVISGNRCINFYEYALEYDSNGWIGFNRGKNYFTEVPELGVVDDCLIYMPGTAYNLNFIMRGEEIVMENEIKLEFDKATTRLAGNPYGRDVFAEQVESKMRYSCRNTIIFPDQIEKVASSFVQGFFAKIVEKVGYAGFDKFIEIKAQNKELEQNIRNDLLG